jgi:cobalt-zinc-cadmium efflux system outer membrane protein
VFEYSYGTATANDAARAQGSEHGYALSQTIPWPGSLNAAARAGDRAGDGLRAEAELVHWDLDARAREAFARLQAAQALLAIAREAEADARSLRDLVSRRAELGESRESDRIKAVVEWLRQQRSLAAAQRETDAAEAVLRGLAVEPLPRPLEIVPGAHPPLPPLDLEALAAGLAEKNPRLLAARANTARQDALLSLAKRSRLPDLDVAVFKDRELDKESHGFSVGVKVPLWNANRGEIARAAAASRVSGAEAARLRVELLGELESRLAELQVASDQASLLEGEILLAAGRSLELVRLSYSEGETSLLDLLDAQRTAREAQREAVQARLALALAFGEVRRLVGPEFNPWRDR